MTEKLDPKGTAIAGAEAFRGTCFGFDVRSTLSFHFLRDGWEGGTPIEVVEDDGPDPVPAGPPLHQWITREDDRIFARLFAADRGYELWVDGVGWYRVDAGGPVIAVPSRASNPIRREENTWTIPMAICLAARGHLPLHAAAVEMGGAAVLLAAPGKFGKTTLAASFLSAGCRILAEDVTGCRLSAVPDVVPGPAMLRVRRDVYEHLEFPGTALLYKERTRAHLAIDPELRGDGSPVPIRAIVFLRAASDDVRIERVDPTAALPDLWTLSFMTPIDEDRARTFAAITDLAARVPVWNLHRPLDFDHLERTVETIAERFGRP